MAKCEYCEQDMLFVDSCECIIIEYIDGVQMLPLLVAEEDAPYGKCHDCGAVPGGYHHHGCDMETCPRCGGQLITCYCDDLIM